jgi:SAM-dependent methyltransferase
MGDADNLQGVLHRRSREPERLDTGEYTRAEYDAYLREARFINRWLGDNAALSGTLLPEIERLDLKEFSVLDVAAGSGELLRYIEEYARHANRRATLVGLDLNSRSLRAMKKRWNALWAIHPVRGDALKLPFADGSFDFCISSLFTHHLSDKKIVDLLREMKRVSRRGVFSIDLHRRPMAVVLFRVFCAVFGMSPLVRDDGSLSILKSFRPDELLRLAKNANLKDPSVELRLPYRLVLQSTWGRHSQA